MRGVIACIVFLVYANQGIHDLTLAALVRDISSIYNNLYLHKDFQRIIQLLYCNTLQGRKSR